MLTRLESAQEYVCQTLDASQTWTDLPEALAHTAPAGEADRVPQYRKIGQALACGKLDKAGRLALLREVAGWIDERL